MIHAVTLDANSKLTRLRHMSWDEVSVRLSQEISKRLDLASYRLGLGAKPLICGPTPGITGNFFFSPAEIPDRVELLQQCLPQEADSIVREADQICGHRFYLLGYPDLDYGPEIDWHLDAVSGKRTPLEPWFKINFLRYEEAGDHKVIWELNRHQHLVTLAKAWFISGKKKYLDEITAQWRSWKRANPHPLGINWASSLEVAFRSLSWLWVLALLADQPQQPLDARAEMVAALALNARHIERYLSTYFSPNTHLLGEAAALFFIGVLCPQLPGASRWKNEGWQILQSEATRQVRADGVYFEQSLYYHVYALDFLLHARLLATRNQVTVPKAFDATIEKMLHVLRVLGQTGTAEGFGDDDGGRVFNPHRNRTENLLDPLAVGAALYQHETTVPLTEEAIWLFGEPATEAPQRSRSSSHFRPHTFPNGGLYIMYDSATDAQMVMDAGPQGAGRCGHGHADALSVTLTGRGQRWLVDSGTCRYISSSNERTTFRGTGAHNTLRVDGLDQAVPEGPFAWSSIPSTRTDRWVTGDSFDFFAGSHDGYTRLPDPVIHRRFVLNLKGKFWIVRDVAEGYGLHKLEILWRFASDLTLSRKGDAFIAALQPGSAESGAALVLQPCGDHSWASTLTRSLVSPAYGSSSPASAVAVSASLQLPAECATLLAPHPASAERGDFSRITARGTNEVNGYRYQIDHEDHCFLFSNSQPWQCGPWSSDATFLYCCLQRGKLQRLILMDSSFCKWQDTEIVTLRHRVERFEWSLSASGDVNTRSSDVDAVQHFLSQELVGSNPAV
jgi:hypothetical protein